MVSINQVVGDEDIQYALEEALEGIPRLVRNASNLVESVQRVLNEAEANLENIRGFTKPLGDHGEQIVGKLSSSADRLDDLLLTLNNVGDRIESGQGTVGQLVYNPELYQKLNRAAQNIELLSRQLEPILNDARVAMDKVARNPRILGGQGALQRITSGVK